MKRIIALMMVLVLMLTACSGATDNTAELQAKDEEITKLADELKGTQVKLTEANLSIEKLTKELDAANLKIEDAKPWFEMDEFAKEQQQKELAEQKAKEAALLAEQRAKEAAEKAAKEEAARIAKEQEEKRGYDTGITYGQLARTPDDFEGKKIKFKGKVIQVMEGDTETQIRLAVNSDYNTILYCGIPKKLTSNNRILDDDIITVYGVSVGLLSYESTMGGKITIPAAVIDKFE